MPAYEAIAFANDFIVRSRGRGLSHMKLQKLVYLTLEQWLMNNPDSVLTTGPEVWSFGPIFPTLYHALKHCGLEPVTHVMSSCAATPYIFNRDVLRAVDVVWGKYSDTPACVLSDLTHAPGSPWRLMAWAYNFTIPRGTEIPASLIKRCVRARTQMLP